MAPFFTLHSLLLLLLLLLLSLAGCTMAIAVLLLCYSAIHPTNVRLQLI